MNSAFGIDHGEISKSWTKMAPKLGRVSQMAKPTDTMGERMNVNYAQWRTKAGYKGKQWKSLDRGAKSWDKSDKPMADFNAKSNRKQMTELPAEGKMYKDAANAAAKGHASANKKHRFLP